MIVYDGTDPADGDVDIGMVVALSTGYRVPLTAFGVTPNQTGIMQLYEHGKRWGKLQRTTALGKSACWLLPTEGRWPTVREMRARFKTHPPDTAWMTGTAPDLSCYTDGDRLPEHGESHGVEQLVLADVAFEDDVSALYPQCVC